MKNKLIFALVLTLVLTGIITFILSNPGNYITISSYTHSYTKAICNSENFCQDYEIFCKNNEVIGLSATGAAVQFSEDWQDPRDKEAKELSC